MILDLKCRNLLKQLVLSQEAPHGLGGLGALAEPVLHTFRLQVDLRRFPARVVLPHDLNESAVPRALLLRYNDAIDRLLLFSYTC